MNEMIKALARPDIVSMAPYVSARSIINKKGIRLDANENPFPHGEEQRWERYLEQQPLLLKTLLSGLYQVAIQQLAVTRGSDEGIDLLIRTFCRAYQDAIMVCSPTYGMYRTSAQIQGVSIVDVPLTVEFHLDTSTMLKAWHSGIKLIFICSPNNPTGNIMQERDVLTLCTELHGKALVIIDEAYIEFAQRPSLTPYLTQYDNLVILRTLSKAYGLAGVRCGSVLGHPDLIRLITKVLAPYPIPTPVECAVREALSLLARHETQQHIETLIVEREKLSHFLLTLPWVKKIYPSATNFLLVRCEHARHVLKYCHRHDIYLRDRSTEPGLTHCIRISVGTPEENQQLCDVLRNFTT